MTAAALIRNSLRGLCHSVLLLPPIEKQCRLENSCCRRQSKVGLALVGTPSLQHPAVCILSKYQSRNCTFTGFRVFCPRKGADHHVTVAGR